MNFGAVAALWFFPVAHGILTVFGAALSITGIVTTVVMIVDPVNPGF
ncbi:MAG: hypothetical protein ACRDSJ_21480 [Rubrobacteraceae bacterium]